MSDDLSVASLKRSLQQFKRSGEAAWLRLEGLPLDNSSTHRALCHTLTRFSLGGERGGDIPRIAVLDWSGAAGCSAEGIAFFCVLARHLSEKGVRVISCKPADRAIEDVLDRSGIQGACSGVLWVPCPVGPPTAVESIATAAIFGKEPNESVDMFCEDLSSALKRLGLSRVQRLCVMGTTQEFLQNVLSHANATHAAAAALLFRRRRPKILQVGFADDGAGIPGTVLRNQRYNWLGWFHDSSVTEVVLQQTLSGRALLPDAGNGGGMARMIRIVLRETTSTVIIRSAAALITLRSSAPGRFEREALTFGAGTQVRLEIRLS